MKTIAVLFVLACLSLYLVNSQRVRKWGQTDTKVLGERTLVAPAEEGKVQQITFEFPEVSNQIINSNAFKEFDLVWCSNISNLNLFEFKFE